MRIFLSVSLFVILTGPINAQYPPIGIIDFYGLHSITEQQARAALQIKEGDEASDSKIEAALKRLEALPGVERARISRVCCAEGKTILYVGTREKGAPVVRFHLVPTGAIRLPEEVIKTGEEFSKAHDEAVLAGDAGEDTASGHSLMKNPQGRAVQEKFITIAGKELKLLRRVLHESANPTHRALAAEIIAYSDDKRRVIRDLVEAMSDADESVRNNAMRALGLIAELAQNKPEKKLKVPFAPFIEMLNSVEWTDRNKSSLALFRLTEHRDKKLLAELRHKALPSLLEMARWKSPGHSIAPFVILSRVSNISDVEIQKALDSNNRDALIETILKRNDWD